MYTVKAVLASLMTRLSLGGSLRTSGKSKLLTHTTSSA